MRLIFGINRTSNPRVCSTFYSHKCYISCTMFIECTDGGGECAATPETPICPTGGGECAGKYQCSKDSVTRVK
jgi:hypothetical protein